MVVGLFVYQHLFGTRETNVSNLPTSDSPTFSFYRLVASTSAGATLPPWEELFRHTASLRRERKVKRAFNDDVKYVEHIDKLN